ncbi:MAG: FAD binding domain-containing protein [Gemmatimonadaceae bacterium]|nr:FAD binding domain-containing protein [Gemmatimonadaceae bacterium]
MHPVRYHRAANLAEALALLGTPDARAIGGGTDLLVLLKEDLTRASTLVDVRGLALSETVTATDDGGLALGGALRIADIANDAAIRAAYPALAEAAASVGTVALRNMGTLGGNLAQRTRCWYFRRGAPTCLKRGGSGCPARSGANEYHAIVESGPCRTVHPSDPAVALAALDARVELTGPAGVRTLDIAALFADAARDATREAAIAPDELITRVVLPGARAGGVQRYEKVMQRGAYDFALVSCAASRAEDGTVRIVLGGVAAGPWQVNSSVEEDVAIGALDDESIDALAERAMYDVEPLAGNAYKVTIAQALLRRAMRALGT